MAIQLEDLRKESTLRELMLDGRTPILQRLEETVICQILPIGAGPAQELEISIMDAKEIATIRDKLSREM